MKYRKMAGEKISVLGFGCMRFPTTSKNAEDIDAEKSAKMLEYAIEKGVNYFDTAYVYHGGKSESFIGGVLKSYRNKIHIATKCPTWEVKCEEDFDRLLNEQLERLQTDYIDFYLMHALDNDRFKNVVEKFNLIDKLNKAKADGKIRKRRRIAEHEAGKKPRAYGRPVRRQRHRNIPQKICRQNETDGKDDQKHKSRMFHRFLPPLTPHLR